MEGGGTGDWERGRRRNIGKGEGNREGMDEETWERKE